MSDLAFLSPWDVKYKSYSNRDTIFTCIVYNSNINLINEVKNVSIQSLNWQAHEGSTHIPNDDTVAAMEDADEIIKRAKHGQGRDLTLDEMFKELDI